MTHLTPEYKAKMDAVINLQPSHLVVVYGTEIIIKPDGKRWVKLKCGHRMDLDWYYGQVEAKKTLPIKYLVDDCLISLPKIPKKKDVPRTAPRVDRQEG